MDLLSYTPATTKAINLISSYAVCHYSIINRFWSISDFLKAEINPTKSLRLKFKKVFPKIWGFYNEISPTLEHFAFGYSLTAYGYWWAANAPWYWEICAIATLSIWFLWELFQAIFRGKIWPMQFIWDLAWVALSVQLNNPALIQEIVNSTIWDLLT